MECYTGTYKYQSLRKGRRALYKIDGTFPPDAPADALYLTASTKKFRMETTGDIRIVELLPGGFDGPLHCRLRIAALESDPEYDALSYMWGDTSFTREIILDDDEAFPVTASLEKALRHVRLRKNVRFLWVDAVCINQGDINERGNQIGLMKEIYSRSKIVRVWINVNLDPETPSVQKLLTLQTRATSDQLGDDPECWTQLLPLLQNPYWNRLWVQQELVFAPQLIFHCHRVVIPGDHLMALQLQLFRKASRVGRPFEVDDAWSIFGRLALITEGPSRNLACGREMIKNRVPVNPRTLRPELSLLRPEIEWKIDPRTWGLWMGKSPIYLLGMLRHSQSLESIVSQRR